MSFLRRGKTAPTSPAPSAGRGNTPEGAFVPMPVVMNDKGAYGEEGPSSLDATARRAPRNDPYAPVRPADIEEQARAEAAAKLAAAPPVPQAPAGHRGGSVAPPGSH
ncbi:MAG: hypothetical protein AAGC46_08940 [Solirubrobacteraceae bacterium]